MKKSCVKNICIKDISIAMRKAKISLFLVPVACGLINIVLLRDIIGQIGYSEKIIAIMFSSVSALNMLITGTLILEMTTIVDRENRVMQIFIATGIDPAKIWLAKIMAAVLFSYSTNLIPLLIAEGFAIAKTGSIIVSPAFYMKFLLIYPIIAIVLLEITAFLMWIIKNGEFVMGIVPAGASLGITYISMLEIQEEIKLDTVLFLGIVVGAVCTGSIFAFLIRKIPKEYLVSV